MVDGQNSTTVRLTVVIPCYNYARYLGDAIDSVLASLRPADEIIVVDDGSEDESAQVAERYPEVTLISKPNGGMASAINAGASAASGDVLVLLDADDMMDPQRLEWVASAFTRPDVVMAWHGLRIMTPDGSMRGILPHIALPSGDLPEQIVRSGLRTIAVTSGIAVRRSAFASVGPIPEDRFRNAAEGYLVRTVPFLGAVAAHNLPLGTYRSHGGSDSRSLAATTPSAVASTLARKLAVVDAEHEQLAASARAAGHELSVERLRALDRIYLTDLRVWARLAEPTRCGAVGVLRSVEVESGTLSPLRRAWDGIAHAWYVALPRRLALVIALVRGDYDLPPSYRQLARAYWLQRRLRATAAGLLQRPDRGGR